MGLAIDSTSPQPVTIAMPVSPNVSRLLRCVLPSLLAVSAACATATYDSPTGADSGGSSSTSGGNPGLGSAGAAPIAGAFDSGGDTSSAAGSTSVMAGTSNAAGFGGSFGSAGAMASGGSAVGGASHAGSGGSGGSSSGACKAPAWVPNVAYRMGDKATKNGKEYTAAWYTMADPESHCCGNGQDWASSVTCP